MDNKEQKQRFWKTQQNLQRSVNEKKQQEQEVSLRKNEKPKHFQKERRKLYKREKDPRFLHDM